VQRLPHCHFGFTHIGVERLEGSRLQLHGFCVFCQSQEPTVDRDPAAPSCQADVLYSNDANDHAWQPTKFGLIPPRFSCPPFDFALTRPLSGSLYRRESHLECVSRDALQKDTIRMTSFSELPLSASLQQRLSISQFHTPTPIQAAAIPHALAGKDVMATAPTGTGKTLALWCR
jgi:hypothetical protein